MRLWKVARLWVSRDSSELTSNPVTVRLRGRMTTDNIGSSKRRSSNFLAVTEFRATDTSTHEQSHRGKTHSLFTIFNLEASDNGLTIGFDGGVLEISTEGGNTFRDILAAGGTFGMGDTTAQSALIEAAPSLVVRHGAATLAASSQR
jgi:hypothetical protein